VYLRAAGYASPRDIGQVRDIVQRAAANLPEVCRTVADAVAAIEGGPVTHDG
jgi:hypothetical protein